MVKKEVRHLHTPSVRAHCKAMLRFFCLIFCCPSFSFNLVSWRTFLPPTSFLSFYFLLTCTFRIFFLLYLTLVFGLLFFTYKLFLTCKQHFLSHRAEWSSVCGRRSISGPWKLFLRTSLVNKVLGKRIVVWRCVYGKINDILEFWPWQLCSRCQTLDTSHSSSQLLLSRVVFIVDHSVSQECMCAFDETWVAECGGGSRLTVGSPCAPCLQGSVCSMGLPREGA